MADISGKEVKIHFLAAFNELAITPEKKNFGSSGIVIEDYNKI